MFPNGAIEHACIAVHPRTGVIVSGWKITSGTRLAYSTDGGAKWSGVAGSLGSKDLFNQQIYYVSFNKYLDKFVAMSGSGVDGDKEIITQVKTECTWQVARERGPSIWVFQVGDKVWSEAHDGGHVCINLLKAPYWHVTHINYKGEVYIQRYALPILSEDCCWVGAPHNHYLAFENKGDSDDNKAHGTIYFQRSIKLGKAHH